MEQTFLNPATNRQWRIEIDGHTIRTCLNGGKVKEILCDSAFQVRSKAASAMMGQMRKGFAYQNPAAAIGEPQCHRFVGKDSNGFMPLATALTRDDFFLTRVAGDFEDEILCHFDGNGEMMETVSLGGKRMTYEQILYDGDLHLCGSESKLLDKEGKVQYAWRNLDTDGEFCSLFRHRNGKHDLVFRTELYGYSVLEVESGQEMHYLPACVHPKEEKKTEEVFIWTGADYNPGTDLLAVTGCIWTCPCSTIVLDFSHPLQPQPPERWLDLRHIVDPDDTRFDDIEFVRWEDSALILRGSDVEDGQWKEVQISVERLRAEL